MWHTGTKLEGDGYLSDVELDDAIDVTVGGGWRWIGVHYTNIHYRSPQTREVVDGNNFEPLAILRWTLPTAWRQL